MLAELVETWTADGLLLHGAFHAPASRDETAIADAVVLLSGVGSNFYGSALMAHLATMGTELGIAALRVNTRGHDAVNTTKSRDGGRVQGAAYEIVDDCRHDVSAWIEHLAGRGFSRIAVLGHSLGAVKAIYSQACQRHAQVAAVIAVSPPRLSHARFLAGREASAFRDSYQAARRLYDAGEPDALFRTTFPLPMLMSAATYLDKYGPESRYDIVRFAPQIDCPLLLTFGEQELRGGSAAFSGLDEELRALPWTAPPRIVTVPGADHFYTGRGAALADVVKGFLTGSG